MGKRKEAYDNLNNVIKEIQDIRQSLLKPSELQAEQTKEQLLIRVIKSLDELKRHYPETLVYMDTGEKTLQVRLADLNIYVDNANNLMFDGER